MINKYLTNPDLTEEVKYWITRNLNNYLKKNEENQSEIEHIIDFLQSDMAPVRLRKMSYVQAKTSAEKWNNLLKKRGATIQETESDVKTFIKLTSGYRFVQLLGENAFKREGALMSHCVSSYFGKTNTKVYSLRDPQNNPHCTIEVVGNNDQIQQIKGKGNGSIHPNYIGKVLIFLKKLNIPVRDSELQNLGYININDVDSELLKYMKTKFKGAKFKKLGGKEYFYLNSKLEKL